MSQCDIRWISAIQNESNDCFDWACLQVKKKNPQSIHPSGRRRPNPSIHPARFAALVRPPPRAGRRTATVTRSEWGGVQASAAVPRRARREWGGVRASAAVTRWGPAVPPQPGPFHLMMMAVSKAPTPVSCGGCPVPSPAAASLPARGGGRTRAAKRAGWMDWGAVFRRDGWIGDFFFFE
uniref:Uncharacterized protein n=1 Tax=Oryza sativa subsp. japonica TaxID=39947 RepID=Q655H4_ORYSJ|nr:hypothetical protein [Oryza sativa Japonica Group]BAD45543.1 hypothetical protein [Oryza sativa Japonica Group]